MSVCIYEQSESPAQTIYRIDDILCSKTTSRGTKVVIADSQEYGRMLFMDGELQSAKMDEAIYHETLVHPAMRLAVSRKMVGLNVLVVGGGEGATVREVLRWSGVDAVDWVEWDVEAARLCEMWLGWAPGIMRDPRLNCIWEDIRKFSAAGTYDLIILDLPDPDGEDKWLYGDEFWQHMKSMLNEKGILVTHCGPVSPVAGLGAGYQRIHAALKSKNGFYHMLIPSFQGEWGFYVWSRDAIKQDWLQEVRVISLPEDLRVADEEQFVAWSLKPLVWRCASLLDSDLHQE